MINQVYKFESEMKLPVACSSPTTPASGDPVRYGVLVGVAENDEDAAGLTTVNFGPGVFSLPVKGIDGSGASAVVAGVDALYYVDADTPKLSKKTTGYYAGIAMGAVDADGTATISVLIMAASSNATITPADGSVTAAKLSATLVKGFIPLDITTARLINTNEIINTTEGGVPDGNTAPILERVDGATDKAIRLNFAATVVTELAFAPIIYPPDLDDASAVEVHILAAMAGTTDTPVVTIAAFEGVGDSNAGGNTAAVTGTSVAEYSVSIAHANVGAHPKALSISLTPAAHGDDALYLYGAWVEYTRK